MSSMEGVDVQIAVPGQLFICTACEQQGSYMLFSDLDVQLLEP